MIKDDCYDFLAELLIFVDKLGSLSLANLWSSLDQLSVGGRPPIYQLLTVPFVFLFGRSEDAALAVNMLFLVIMAVSVYNIGRMSSGTEAGLLAAFLALTFPPIVHLTRTYLPHGALPACVALSLWSLLLLVRDRSVKSAWLFAATAAFGLLVHSLYVRAMAIPVLVVGVYVLFFQEAPRAPDSLRAAPVWLWKKLKVRLAWAGLVPAGAVALGLVLSWYLTHGIRLLDAKKSFAEFRAGKIPMAGFPGIDSPQWFWLQSTPGVISNLLALFLVAGLVFALIKRRDSGLILALVLICAYASYSYRGTPRYWYYFALVLPVSACLIAIWVGDIRTRWLSSSLTGICVLTGMFNFYVVTWGVPTWGKSFASVMGSPLLESTCKIRLTTALCPDPPKADPWPIREIQEVILKDQKCRKGKPCKLMSSGGIWRTRFRYALIQSGHRGKLKVVAQPSGRKHSSFDFDMLLNSQYLLYPTYNTGQGLPYVKASAKFLRNAPSAFADAHETIAEYPFPGGKAKLIKRVKPLSLEEAEAAITAVKVPDKEKTQGDRLLRRLRFIEERGQGAVTSEGKAKEEDGSTKDRRALIAQYRSQGRFQRVADLLKERLEEHPNDRSSRMELAETYQKMGQTDAAVEELQKTISMVPESTRPRRVLAEIYRSREEYDRAIQLFREALEINPKYLGARVELGKTYRKMGQIDSAIAELEEAVAIAPKKTWPRRTLAAAYSEAGEASKAMTLYEEVLQIDPRDKIARRALRRLRAETRQNP